MAYRFARVVLRNKHIVAIQDREDPQAPYKDSLAQANGAMPTWDLRVTDFAWARAGLACMDLHCRRANEWDRTHTDERDEHRRAYRRAVAVACGLVLPTSAAGLSQEPDAFTPAEGDRAVDSFLSSLANTLPDAPPDYPEVALEELPSAPAPWEDTDSPPEPEVEAASPCGSLETSAPAAEAMTGPDPVDYEALLAPILPCGVGGTVGTRAVPTSAADLQRLGLVVKVSDDGVLAQCVGRVQTARNAMPSMQKGKLGEGLWLSRLNVRYPSDLAVGDIIRLTSTMRLNDTAKIETEKRVLDHVMSQDGLLVLPNF